MKSVFVYLNQRIPRYAVCNLKSFQERFPNRNVIYLSDLKSNIEIVSGLGIDCDLIQSPLDVWDELKRFDVISSSFRKGFWFNTLARFHAIAQLSQKINNESILQIECDVLILNNFPFDQMDLINKEVAFPIINEFEAVPSIVYFKNKGAVENLMNYFSSQMISKLFKNDMIMLRDYSKRYKQRVEILPTNFSDRTGFQPWAKPILKKEMSNNFNKFSGIFDGATWGQFLSGEDPRNTIGIRRVFHEQKHHAVNPSNFKWIHFNEDNSIKIQPLDSIQTFPLYCLHIHSKDLKFFKLNFSERIRLRIMSASGGEKWEFMPLVGITNLRVSSIKSIFKALINRIKTILRSL